MRVLPVEVNSRAGDGIGVCRTLRGCTNGRNRRSQAPVGGEGWGQDFEGGGGREEGKREFNYLGFPIFIVPGTNTRGKKNSLV